MPYGQAPHIADKILNHQSGTISGVAAVYQQHEFLDERKTALVAWGNFVQSLINGSERGNVVQIAETTTRGTYLDPSLTAEDWTKFGVLIRDRGISDCQWPPRCTPSERCANLEGTLKSNPPA